MKIGLIDYYLGEWHAHHYPAWINEQDPTFEAAYAYGEIDSPVDGLSTEAFCEKYGITPCKTIEEVCEKSDFLMILSPDNPEKHLEYARKVFPFGKPCYVDKTFAPDEKTAAEIFALAKRYGVKFFSSSSLRFAAEWKGIGPDYSFVNLVCGGNVTNELIHPIEIADVLMPYPAKEITCLHKGVHNAFLIGYGDGRSLLLTLTGGSHGSGYRASVETRDKDGVTLTVSSGFFQRMIAEILRMFGGAPAPVSEETTLRVMHNYDGVLLSLEKPGETVRL